MRLIASVLISACAFLGLTAGASAQSGPPSPFCRSDADFLTATATVLQRGVPAFLEVEVALQNKTQGRIHFDPRRFVLAPDQGEPVSPLTLEQAKRAVRDPGQQIFGFLAFGIFGVAQATQVQDHWAREVEARFFRPGELPPGGVVKGSVHFIPNPRLTLFALRLEGLTAESGERLATVHVPNCLLPPRLAAPAASTPTSAPAPSPTPAARVIVLTARASIGPVVVSVSNVEFARDATALTVMIENTGATEADIFSAVGDATLMDNTGKSYAVRMLRTDLADQVGPHAQIRGRLAFEPLPLPPAVTSATLTLPGIRVGDEVYEIKIPLRF